MSNALLIRRRGMMQSAAAPLPYDSKIAYLGSSTYCHIDLGIIPDDHIGVYVECEKTSTADVWLLGCRNDSGNTRWGFGKATNTYYGWGSYTSGFSFTSGYLSLNWLRNHKFYTNSSSKNLANPLPFTPIYSISVFGWHNQGSYNTSDCGMRVSRLKVSRDSDIIMDLIPVRVGTVGCFYDEISQQLFYNGGTGDLVLGPDIV